MSSNFNYRIDAPFSEKKRFFRVCVYLVLLPLFTGLSTGMIYVLGDLMNFDINEPICSSELSGIEITLFFSSFGCLHLSQKGIQFEQQPTEQRYLWKEAILKDPSGNKIKLYWAGENRLNPP